MALIMPVPSCFYFDRDLGVFVGGLEKGGVAARSGKLSTSDRILACNGMDFTDENMNNEQ